MVDSNLEVEDSKEQLASNQNRNGWADDELAGTEYNICCNILFSSLFVPSIINNKKYYKIHGKMAIVYNAKQVLSEILISCVLIIRSQISQTHSSLGLKCRCMKDCQGSILEFGPCKLLLQLVKNVVIAVNIECNTVELKPTQLSNSQLYNQYCN